MCAGLDAVCGKFGLTVDQDDLEEMPGLVEDDSDSERHQHIRAVPT